MGVVGRDEGVGIELVVLVVAVLTLLRPSDTLDCGRRIPSGIVLWDSALGALGMPVGDGESWGVEGRGRKAEGAEGLEVRLRSLSLSFAGEGESSIMRTHPEESPPDPRLRSPSESKLGRRGFVCSSRSSLLIDRIDEVEGAGETDTDEGPAFGGGGGGIAIVLLVVLPMRSLGTRVWIFCSNTLTRALISDTICTPLLLDAVPGTPLLVLVELRLETLRLTAGLGTGVRGGKREGVDSDGTVPERARDDEELVGGVARRDIL